MSTVLPAPSARPLFMHVDRVHPHPLNVREDLGDLFGLARSIEQHGILQPLAVEPHPDKPGHVQIIAGHRRYEAAQLAGLDHVPVVIRAAVGEPEELMLVENWHRADLNPMDKAEAMDALRHKGYSNERIAQSIGLKASTVSFYLALTELAPATRARVRNGTLPAADAVALVRKQRARVRKGQGRPAAGPVWEPDHFTGQHPLARKAKTLCDGREHTMRRRYGKLACGECWETVIRADERAVAAAIAAISGPLA